jgi:hypothetical protein
MTSTQRRRKQTKTKTPRRPKAPTAAFWAERAAKIAAARARNEKSGMTERERRAQRKAERAKRAAKGAKTPPPKTTKTTATTKTKTTTPRPDVSSGAYIARVLKAIDKTTTTGQRAYVGRYLGADAGAGWVILGTDGSRALLQVGPITNDAQIARPFVSATGPACGFDLTADVEQALRTLDAETVTLQIDAQRKRLTVTGADGGVQVVPITGTLKSAAVRLRRRFLLDGLGRGGRLRYDAKPDRVLIETPDAVRYVVMAIQTTVPPKPTTTPTTTTKRTTTKRTTPPAAAPADSAAEPTTTTTTQDGGAQ